MNQADVDRYCRVLLEGNAIAYIQCSYAIQMIKELGDSDHKRLNLSIFVPNVLYRVVGIALNYHGKIPGIALAINLCALYNLDVKQYIYVVNANNMAIPTDKTRAAAVVTDLIIETIQLMPNSWSANAVRANSRKIEGFYCADLAFEKPVMLTKIIRACAHLAVQDCYYHADFVERILYRATTAWLSKYIEKNVFVTSGLDVAINMCIHHVGDSAFTDAQLQYAEQCLC